MYKVIPWDDPDNVKEFASFIGALQYGNMHYGSRYDLVEV